MLGLTRKPPPLPPPLEPPPLEEELDDDEVEDEVARRELFEAPLKRRRLEIDAADPPWAPAAASTAAPANLAGPAGSGPGPVPEVPKRPPTAYQLFLKAYKANPAPVGGVTAAARWKELNPEARRPYEDAAAAARVKYAAARQEHLASVQATLEAARAHAVRPSPQAGSGGGAAPQQPQQQQPQQPLAAAAVPSEAGHHRGGAIAPVHTESKQAFGRRLNRLLFSDSQLSLNDEVMLVDVQTRPAGEPKHVREEAAAPPLTAGASGNSLQSPQGSKPAAGPPRLPAEIKLAPAVAGCQGGKPSAAQQVAEAVVDLELPDEVLEGPQWRTANVGVFAGSRVRISGLRERPDLNGETGAAMSWDDGSGRWKVLMDDGSWKNLRPANLTVVARVDGKASTRKVVSFFDQLRDLD